MTEKEDYKDKSMQSLFLEINRHYAGRCFQQVACKGIQPGQIPFIMMISTHDGCSQSEMARKLEIKPPTVNVSIQRLEKSGIVCRRRDEKDQRIMRVYLTEYGRQLVTEIKEYVAEIEKVMFRNFSETELCLLRRFFIQMLENIDSIPGVDICKCEKKNEQM